MKALTKEQKEYVKMKQSFDNMFKAYDKYREIVACCDLNLNMYDSNYKVEGVFYKLLNKHTERVGQVVSTIDVFKKVISDDWCGVFIPEEVISQMADEFEKQLNK